MSLRQVAWAGMTLLALAIVVVVSRYLTGNPEVFFPEQRQVFLDHLPRLLLHVTGGMVALALGPFQFLPQLRARRPGLHRALGRLYLMGITVGAVGGLSLAPMAYGGLVSSTGFTALALAWLWTSGAALVAIRGRRISDHRRWMTRSYALTFAAVTLRLWLPLLEAAGLSFEAAYQTVAWLSWVPNLLLVELALRGALRRGPVPAEA